MNTRERLTEAKKDRHGNWAAYHKARSEFIGERVEYYRAMGEDYSTAYERAYEEADR